MPAAAGAAAKGAARATHESAGAAALGAVFGIGVAVAAAKTERHDEHGDQRIGRHSSIAQAGGAARGQRVAALEHVHAVLELEGFGDRLGADRGTAGPGDLIGTFFHRKQTGSIGEIHVVGLLAACHLPIKLTRGVTGLRVVAVLELVGGAKIAGAFAAFAQLGRMRKN